MICIFNKKLGLFFIVVIWIVLFNNLASAQSRVAVLDFVPDGNVSKNKAGYITDVFKERLVNSSLFVVVERSELSNAMNELHLQNDDMFDESTAVELGKLVGAEIVFYGNITFFDNQNKIAIWGMEVETATLRYAERDGGKSDKQLEEACKRIISKILKENRKHSLSDSTETDRSNQMKQNNTNDVFSEIEPLLTAKEIMFCKQNILYKWNISPKDTDMMRPYYRRNLSAGISMAAAGGTILLGSVVGMTVSVILPYGLFVFPITIVTSICGGVITPLCAIFFTRAGLISSIYRKATGEKLTFFDRTSIGGGYDWDKKEVTVAMAIKL